MPLKKGTSQRVIGKNIKELVTTKPSKARSKAISTLAKEKGISRKEAKRRQAIAIALNAAKKRKK